MIEHDYISASFGNRKPAYANWFYVGLDYITDKGNVAPTASHANTLSSIDQRAVAGCRKIGKTVGFGDHKDEVVTGFSVTTPTYKPSGVTIEIREDASSLFIRTLPNQGGLTPDQHASRDFLKENAGRRFGVMCGEDVPQMSSLQFFNTMPTEDAPAGFFLPRGVCRVVEGIKSDES